MKYKLSFILTGAVLLTGIFIIFLVRLTNQQIKDSYAQNQPFIQVSDNLKFKTTVAHLWFEEFMAGDTAINPEKDVITKFTGSRQILTGILDGTKTELGTFEKLADPDIKLTVRQTIEDIAALEGFTRERWLNKQSRKAHLVTDTLSKSPSQAFLGEEAGGELDTKFDAAYEKTQVSLDELKKQILAKVRNDIQTTERVAVMVLFLLGSLFAAMAFILYKLQSRSERIALEQQTKLEKEKIRLEKMTAFADAIGQGYYETSLVIDSAESDSLALALGNMKDKLKTVAEEDKKRNWVNEGLAKMSEILRKNHETEDIYTNIVTFVVKYLDANQGGLFVVNSSNVQDVFIELKSCVAFDRKKYLSKRIEIGEGMVGRCVQEKESIYVTQLPNEYITITSGLGGANPACLLIMPLKVNEQIFGVLELASFTKLESYQIDFIERIAESIGAAIASVDTTARTKKLLEIAQQQAEELRAQEEEMRQNMEELTATQEEMRRKEKEYLKIINTTPTVEPIIAEDSEE
jgi:hypothetical protein